MQPTPGPWSFALLVSPPVTLPIVNGRGTAQVPFGIVDVVVVVGFFVVVGCAAVVVGETVVVVDVDDAAADAVQNPIPSRRQRRMTARRQPASRSAKTPHVAPHWAITSA